MLPWVMARRSTSIFAYLFLFFSAILLMAIGLFSAVNYVSVNERLSSQAVHSLVALSRSLVVNLDSNLLNLDRISVTPIFSRPLKALLPRAWSDKSAAAGVVDLLSGINGPLKGVSQVNLYDFEGHMVGVGRLEGSVAADVRRQPWFAEAQKAQGERIIVGTHMDPVLDDLNAIDRGRRYVSLCRVFSDPETQVSGIIEVEDDCANIFQELDIVASNTQNGRRFVLVSDTGTQIYPYTQQLPDLEWIRAGIPQDISIQVNHSVHPKTGRDTVMAYSHSLEADWYLVIVQDQERLYADIPDFTRQILLNAALVSLLALAGAFWAARRVSAPLHKLSDAMQVFTLEPSRAEPAISGTSGLAELDGLNQSFDRLRWELRQSFAEAVLLKAHKHRAQMLALQSQMNPHFMFNMLAAISVMAEEGQGAAIPAVVDDLADMMRYIASNEDAGHTLGSEFDFVRRYLQCQKRRFQDDLTYVVECPETLRSIVVPRLLLQPFVENAIQYATRLRPPWSLNVKAGGGDRFWWVEIEDNGPGFGPQTLVDLRAEFARMDTLSADLSDLPDLHVDGMGLTNTYARLRLTYGAQAVMELDNRSEGGARVRIGGCHV